MLWGVALKDEGVGVLGIWVSGSAFFWLRAK